MLCTPTSRHGTQGNVNFGRRGTATDLQERHQITDEEIQKTITGQDTEYKADSAGQVRQREEVV
jgi:hypothetical protein